MAKLISKYTLNPDASTYRRLRDDVYNSLIENINQHFIANKDNGVAKIVFGCRELKSEVFSDYYIRLFDDEEICNSTAERFKKELTRGDYRYETYNSKYQYFYHDFKIDLKSNGK